MPGKTGAVGGLASRFTVMLWLVVPPTLVAAHEKFDPGVSVVTTVSPQPSLASSGDSGSDTDQATGTFDRCHPSSPSAAGTTGAIAGGVASRLSPTAASANGKPNPQSASGSPGGLQSVVARG